MRKPIQYRDIAGLNASSLKEVLRLLEFEDLMIALSGDSSNRLLERTRRLLSPEKQRALQAGIENLKVHPVSRYKTKKAQKTIRNIARALIILKIISLE